MMKVFQLVTHYAVAASSGEPLDLIEERLCDAPGTPGGRCSLAEYLDEVHLGSWAGLVPPSALVRVVPPDEFVEVPLSEAPRALPGAAARAADALEDELFELDGGCHAVLYVPVLTLARGEPRYLFCSDPNE